MGDVSANGDFIYLSNKNRPLVDPAQVEAKAIIEALVEGRANALESLYSRYREDFFRWADKRVKGNRQDFEDAWQEAVITFYEQVVSSRLTNIRVNVRVLLFVIGFRALLKSKRKTKRLLWKDEIDEALAGMVFQEEPALLISREKLLEVMDQLSGACREILILRYFEEISIPDIQTKLNYNTPNTTSATLSRCMKKLKELLLVHISLED